MDNLEFTDDEIKDQLASLGYFDVSETRLKQFRKDLQRLVEHDRSSGSSSWFTGISSPSTNSDASPSSQSQQPTTSTKPTLSRYQPHIQVSPRTVEPVSFGTSHQTADASLDSSPHLPSSHISPAAKLQTLTLDEDDETENISATNDPTSELPFTPPSNFRGNDDDDDIGGSDSADATPSPSSEFLRPRIPSLMDSTNSERKVVRKRKVLRKQENGESAIFDESLVTDGDMSYRVHDISVDDMSVQYNRVQMPPTLPPRPHTARPLRKSSDAASMVDQPLPSYIRPNTSHPHTRNLRKTDPVNRYHQYRDAWNTVKAPGEKSHKDLRWEVKAQMMYKDEPQPKPQRIYMPNTYVVPTSKKRSALRWEVRHALENGLPVPSTFTVM